MMRAADGYPSIEAYVVASYAKPAVALRELERIIGRDRVRESLRQYARRWLLKHPAPIDFFRTVSSMAGRDLDWFWYPWWYTTGVLDLAIAGVETAADGAGERVTLRIENLGQLALPSELLITTANGETRRVTIPADTWLSGAKSHTETVSTAGRVERVVIDPDGVLPDVKRENNTWARAVN